VIRHPDDPAGTRDAGTRDAGGPRGGVLRARAAGAWRLRLVFARYTAGSVVAGLISEATFLALYGPRLVGAGAASVAAFVAGAVPNYLMNRRWAWARRDRASVRRELLPYAAIVVASALLAAWLTGLVAANVDRLTAARGLQVVIVNAAFLATYGVMFLIKFVLFDRLLRDRAER
jgi:putative flippase GtrA